MPSEDHRRVMALYVVHTWIFDAADCTPYIYIYSKDSGSGKTRMLDTLLLLVRNAERAEDMTPAVMFRIIERSCPTLLMDEVDATWSGSRQEWHRKTLNTGYKQGGCAWRESGGQLNQYSTFCPKVLAGINNGHMPETIKSRCIPMPLARMRADQSVERLNMREVSNSTELETLLDAIFQFRETYIVDVIAQRPLPINGLGDRQNEICEPLLALANVFGIEHETRESIQNVFRDAGNIKLSPLQNLLERIRTAFGDQPKMFSQDLCQAIGPSYSGRQLAILLEECQVEPRDVRIGSRVARGYRLIDFQDAFAAHLEPLPTELHVIEGGKTA